MEEEQTDTETRPLTKEEWIQRVMEEGREETIKKEMIRLGFWIDKPLSLEEERQIAIEQEEIKRLQEELAELRKEHSKLANLKYLLREARKKRIEESKRKRAERKAWLERQRAEAKARWEAYKESHIIHAGEGVSAGLNSWKNDEQKLMELGLPLIGSSLALAEEMGLSLSELKWLTFHRDTATLCHYYRFTIPKKSGGEREISSPKPLLRQAQRWVKKHILDKLVVSEAAYGFVPGRNIVDGAKLHVGKEAVIKMDLKDFFPHITFERVRGLFSSLGYSQGVATLLALLCTEPPRKKVEFDGKYYYVAVGECQLPQGACTSPAITNLICRNMDRRLTRLAETHGFIYTRYADDLTFSCGKEDLEKIGSILYKARAIIRSEGFVENEKKTRILRKGRRQQVTGIVVNEKINLNRQTLRAFRALLHDAEQNGLQAANRRGHPNLWQYIQGYTSYVQMVRPDMGARFAAQVERIGQKYGLPVSLGIVKGKVL